VTTLEWRGPKSTILDGVDIEFCTISLMRSFKQQLEMRPIITIKSRLLQTCIAIESRRCSVGQEIQAFHIHLASPMLTRQFSSALSPVEYNKQPLPHFSIVVSRASPTFARCVCIYKTLRRFLDSQLESVATFFFSNTSTHFNSICEASVLLSSFL
jgi:hypothetical protein